MSDIVFEKNGKRYTIFQGKILEYHKDVEDYDRELYEKNIEYNRKIYKQKQELKQQPKTTPQYVNLHRKYVLKDKKTGCNIYLDYTQVSQADMTQEEERIRRVRKALKKKERELREEYEKTHPKD